VPRSSGFRRRTKGISTKPKGSRSVPRPDIYLAEYRLGDKVLVMVNPSVQKGMPHRRYHGKVGEVISRRGRGYILRVMQGEKPKEIAVLPDHITPLVT